MAEEFEYNSYDPYGYDKSHVYEVNGVKVRETQIKQKMAGTSGWVAGCCGMADFGGLYGIREVSDVLAIRIAAHRKPLKRGTMAVQGQMPLGYDCGYVVCTTAVTKGDYAVAANQKTEEALKAGGFTLLAEFVNPAHPSVNGASIIHLWGAPSIDCPEVKDEEKKNVAEAAKAIPLVI